MEKKMSKREYFGTALTRYLFGVDNAKTIETRNIDGQQWYMAANICLLLGIVNHSVAVHKERKDRLHPLDSEKCKDSIHIGNYGKDQVQLVNNGGMLKLIYQADKANKPAAKAIVERIDDIPKHLIPPQWHKYLTWEE
jgi:prophage antirepressor-like protein